jgi:hypothetical protein
MAVNRKALLGKSEIPGELDLLQVIEPCPNVPDGDHKASYWELFNLLCDASGRYSVKWKGTKREHKVSGNHQGALLRTSANGRAESADDPASLGKINALAEEVWRSPEAAQSFLHRPHPLLDGRLPIDVARSSEAGARTVEGILGRLKYGSGV